jgi:hypothetical protein
VSVDDDTSEPIATSEPIDDADQRPHRLAVTLLTILGAIVLLVTTVNVWVDRAALNTDNWVDAADDLLADEDIRLALSAFLVDELYANVDVSGEIAKILPGDLSGLSGTLAAALRAPATQAIDRVLATQAAAEVWSSANRITHEAIVRVLKDEGTVVTSGDGRITLDLRQLVVQLATTVGLSSSVTDRIPQDVGQLEIVQSDTLQRLQTAVTVVQWASVLLLIVVLALFAGAIALAAGWRRVATRNVGIAVAIVGLLVAAGLRFSGNILLDQVVRNDSNRSAGDAVWWIASQLLRDIGRVLMVIGVVIAVGAVLAGASTAARTVRGWVAPAFVGGVGPRVAIGAAIWLLLVLWAPLPLLTTWWGILLCAVVVAACVEGMRRLCLDDADAARGSETPAPV